MTARQEQGPKLTPGAEIDERVQQAANLFRTFLGKGHRLLDIGCGVGEVSRFLAEAIMCQEIVGIDNSGHYLQQAKDLNITTLLCDVNAQSLPVPNGAFDAVFCGELLEHVLDPDFLLDEISRVLQPQGICVLTTCNLASWINRLVLLAFGWQPFDTSASLRHNVGRPRVFFLESDRDNPSDSGHLHVMCYGALQQLLKLHGFQILAIRGAPISSPQAVRRHAPDRHLRALLYHVMYGVDWSLARFPSLAHRLVVAFKKQS
jgi:ubiquinone/menaquinone biosynthesis C-methylase UbiE